MENFLEDHRRPETMVRVLPETRTVRRIGIALFNGFALPQVADVVEVFHSANALGETTQTGRASYDVRLLSVCGEKIASSSSVFVCTDSIDSATYTHDFHALFIAGGAGVHGVLRDGHLVNWLRRIYPRNELIFPIAEGRLLLDVVRFGRTSNDLQYSESTHLLARGSLTASISPNSSSPQRTALAVVEDDLGAEIARQIAGCMKPRFETPSTSTVRNNLSVNVSKQIQASVRWLEMNSDRPIVIDEAAQIAAMSGRNFLRRFKIEMGMTPSDYLLQVRLDMCCRMLTETSLPVDKIARRCGIGNGERLAKIFQKHLSTTPTKYRMSKQNSITPA